VSLRLDSVYKYKINHFRYHIFINIITMISVYRRFGLFALEHVRLHSVTSKP